MQEGLTRNRLLWLKQRGDLSSGAASESGGADRGSLIAAAAGHGPAPAGRLTTGRGDARAAVKRLEPQGRGDVRVWGRGAWGVALPATLYGGPGSRLGRA